MVSASLERAGDFCLVLLGIPDNSDNQPQALLNDVEESLWNAMFYIENLVKVVKILIDF